MYKLSSENLLPLSLQFLIFLQSVLKGMGHNIVLNSLFASFDLGLNTTILRSISVVFYNVIVGQHLLWIKIRLSGVPSLRQLFDIYQRLVPTVLPSFLPWRSFGLRRSSGINGIHIRLVKVQNIHIELRSYSRLPR